MCGIDVGSAAARRTALHLASWAGHAAVVKRIVQAKGDPSATAMDGVSCLHFACQKGVADVIAELIAAKADIRAKDRSGSFWD